ncbi:MAG: hypothetical protein PHU51_04260 [Candidatus Nanoarchaeia archaeon]|nr:hypothetical protein [Candidatus Nanoarchaeia archaeon]
MEIYELYLLERLNVSESIIIGDFEFKDEIYFGFLKQTSKNHKLLLIPSQENSLEQFLELTHKFDATYEGKIFTNPRINFSYDSIKHIFTDTNEVNHKTKKQFIEELVEHYTKTNHLEHPDKTLIKFNLDLTLF